MSENKTTDTKGRYSFKLQNCFDDLNLFAIGRRLGLAVYTT